jgi:hypothetical protein
MHYIRVMISHRTSPEGEQWVTHTFREDELDFMMTRLRDWESRGIPFEQQYTQDPSGPAWYLESELQAEQEMAEEADDYDPEGEWF